MLAAHGNGNKVQAAVCHGMLDMFQYVYAGKED
jgi:hypothetical protein